MITLTLSNEIALDKSLFFNSRYLLLLLSGLETLNEQFYFQKIKKKKS